MADTLDDELRAARPEADALAKGKVRAALQDRLFGVPAQPVKLARYVILDCLGQGGMGVVYSAYDPVLDRKIAIKLLRPEPDRQARAARMRLQREAQALARLSHPNVVPVHDVGLIDDQVFIVMEFVRGQTLRQWLDSEAPHWRSIVDAYAQAGQGLAAAHEVGLVHRDFKPDNALMGEDGRVRVVDLGLVRGHGAATTETPAGARSARGDVDSTRMPGQENTQGGDLALDATLTSEPADMATLDDGPGDDLARPGAALTSTGAVMGTPAYMAPEQFKNAGVGPATDQFSLCVSLYEALYRQRPFAGESISALKDAVTGGRVREPPRSSRVPGWVYATLRRGLAVDPEQRFPSMRALLGALRKDPARARRRWLAGSALALVLLVLVHAGTRARPGATGACQDARMELAGVWDDERRGAVEEVVLGTEHPYAPEAWSRIQAGLDSYARQWVAMHEDACTAHQRGHQSSLLLDKRMACLARRRSALASATIVLGEVRANTLGEAVEVVSMLPGLAYCADSEALLAEVPPPEDPELARQVAELRDRASRARALEDAGRYQDSLDAIASALATAENLDHLPVLAELLLARGRVLARAEQRQEAIAPLRRAIQAALAADMTELAVEAMARLIYVQGTSRGPGDDLHAYLSMAEAMSRSRPHSFARALLLNNAGTMYMAAQDRERARRYFEYAMAAREGAAGEPDIEPGIGPGNGPGNGPGGQDDIELDIILVNLAMVTDEDARREELFERALEHFERRLGHAHPLTLTRQVFYSHFVRDLDRAGRITESACALLERYHADRIELVEACLHSLGFIEAERGHGERAAEVFTRLAGILAGAGGSLRVTRALAQGYALLHGGEARDALAPLQEVASELAQRADLPWWDKEKLAHARAAMGASELELGRPERAIEHLEPVLPVYEELAGFSLDREHRQRLAWTRTLLARALWHEAPSQRDPAATRQRAGALLDAAEEWYRSAGQGYGRRLQELDAWRRAQGMSP